MIGTIRIIIADDHEIFRNGFKLLLENQDQLKLVGEAGNGRELLQLSRKLKPDIVITDITMPVMDGIEACKQLHKELPDIGIIALSMFNDDNLIVDMLEAGARGYLLKNTTKAELLEATKAVYQGESYYCLATTDRLARMIAKSKFNPYKIQTPVRFTPRELEVIELICQQLTNKEIASRLNLSIRTVETHREKIQEKADARNVIGIVIYAIKHDLFNVHKAE